MAMMNTRRIALWGPAAALAIGASAHAAGVVNGGFETGDLSGWTTAADQGAYSSATASAVASFLLPDGTIARPKSGGYFALLRTDVDPDEIYSVSITLDQMLNLAAGTTVQGFFRFATYLPAPANTFAYAIDRSQSPQHVFYEQDAGDVNYRGDTGWQPFSYTIPQDDTTVGFQLVGFNPYGAPSYMMLDDVKVAGVPEPAGWATMIAGFGLLGGAVCRRPRARRARDRVAT